MSLQYCVVDVRERRGQDVRHQEHGGRSQARGAYGTPQLTVRLAGGEEKEGPLAGLTFGGDGRVVVRVLGGGEGVGNGRVIDGHGRVSEVGRDVPAMEEEEGASFGPA